MKTKLLIILSFFSIFGFSQTLPNMGMESWTSITYSNPTPWYNSNYECLQKFSVTNVTRVTGFSGFAVRMETKANAADTAFGYINHSPNDPTQDLGVPYSQQPTAINGYFRYNLPGNDTALILVTFKKSGVAFDINMIKIRGTGSQPIFAPFAYTVSCSMVPDSIIIASASSNAISNVGIQNGSYLELDQLAFSGPGVTQAIPGGDFETWGSASIDNATGWSSWGNTFAKSTSSYSGLYAASMGVFDYGGGNFDVAGMTNGIPSTSTTIGGHPFSSMNDTLLFYYKYTSSGNDTAACYVNLKKNFSPIWGYAKFLTKNPVYSLVKMPLTPFSAPDSIIVFFTASAWSSTPHQVNGSNLWIDNLYYKSSVTGISQQALLNNETTVFPNPASTKINILISAGVVNEKLEIEIFDALGKKVYSESRKDAQGLIPINIENFSSGLYYYKLSGDKTNIRDKFIKQ